MDAHRTDTPGAEGKLLSRVASDVPELLARIDRTSGRLLNAEGGFSLSDQHPIYAFALLYRQPGTVWQGRAEVLAAARGMGDAIAALQNPHGYFPFFKADGSAWGDSVLPWHVGPWLEAWRLLGEDLDAGVRSRWQEGFARWMGAVAEEISGNGRLHNIQAYSAAILVRGACLMGLDALAPAGEAFLRRIAALQTEDGYWPEGGCPTVGYNFVYLQALGLYYAATRAAWVRPHLERGQAFHRRFTYPDGTGVETIDSRVRHHQTPPVIGGLAFLPFPAGRELVERIIERHLATWVPGAVNGHLAYLLDHWPILPDASLPADRPDTAAALGGRALTRRSGDWFWCLSGLGVPAAERQRFLHHRWQNDLGQRFSLWHATLGLVVGGGSSRLQPAFQTFSVVVGGAVHFAPDAAHVEEDVDGEDVLHLAFGPVRCTLGVRVLPDGAVVARWRADWPEAAGEVGVTANVTLPYLLDRQAASSLTDTPPETLAAKKNVVWIERPPAPVPPWALTIGRLQVELPAATTFHWPEYPFNPYAIDNVAPAKEAVGSLSFHLPSGVDRRVRLTVR